MKVLIGAAVAALAMTGAAFAQTQTTPPPQTSACAPLQPSPGDLPDGAEANRRQMERGNETFTAWAEAQRLALQCRRTEAEAAQAHASALGQAYNTEAAALQAAIAAWTVEANEFNARNTR